MEVYLKEVATGILTPARILPAVLEDMPLQKDGWNFNWRSLHKTKGAQFYKLSLEATPGEVEGMLMVSVVGDEMFCMDNVELAPHNIGKNGKFDWAAGCLIGFACHLSFEHGKGHYAGFLSFESKTVLMRLYEEKYGATRAVGQKMFIDPQAGRRLMEKYLGIKP